MSGCVHRWAQHTGLASLRAKLQSRVSSAMARSAASAAVTRGVGAAGSSVDSVADSVTGSVVGDWQSLYSSLTSETATFLTCPRNSEASFLHCKGHQVGSAWSRVHTISRWRSSLLNGANVAVSDEKRSIGRLTYGRYPLPQLPLGTPSRHPWLTSTPSTRT